MTRMRIPFALMVLGFVGCGPPDPCHRARSGGEVCRSDAGMAADTALSIWVLESNCGSACDPAPLSCEVSRTGPVLTLTLVRRICPATEFPNTVCLHACAITGSTCFLPPLPAGEYTLRSEGQADVGLSVGAGSTLSCPAQ